MEWRCISWGRWNTVRPSIHSRLSYCRSALCIGRVMRRKLSGEELIKVPERSAKLAQFNVGEDPSSTPLGGIQGLNLLVSR